MDETVSVDQAGETHIDTPVPEEVLFEVLHLNGADLALLYCHQCYPGVGSAEIMRLPRCILAAMENPETAAVLAAVVRQEVFLRAGRGNKAARMSKTADRYPVTKPKQPMPVRKPLPQGPRFANAEEELVACAAEGDADIALELGTVRDEIMQDVSLHA